MSFNSAMSKKHPVEDEDSWASHLDHSNRRLKHNNRNKPFEFSALERQKEEEYRKMQEEDEERAERKRIEKAVKRAQRIKDLYGNSGIRRHTTHGMVIDAGSGGSRLHVYEWSPRVLKSAKDVAEAVSGRKISFPGTESRWTERLKPGISDFGSIQNEDELEHSIAEYLEPLINFATSILHEKTSDFASFPIYFRATAGMRVLETVDRARIVNVVRKLFHNDTYCPFYFEDEQARVLSGEEEAIFGWLGVNYLASDGDVLQDSAGSGTVISPRETYGALDLGGASTQIGFYESNEDIMANLFKLQIGQGKHWNVYTHSFLFYGINEATNRFQARLANGKSPEERLVKGIHNPCLPGGSKLDVHTDIHFENGMETWKHEENYPSGTGVYHAILNNENETNNFEQCNALVHELLHMEQNTWCEFDHKGDCSFAGVYQPKLPPQSENFGEFIAFSNYFHVWEFLGLPERATIQQLENATQYACSLSKNDTLAFNNGRIDEDDAEQYCFRSVYALNMLRGYGFQDQDHITAKNVINGHKVGWALGAMIYEINTLPWQYHSDAQSSNSRINNQKHYSYSGGGGSDPLKWESISILLLVAFAAVLFFRRSRTSSTDVNYEPVKDVESYQHNC